MLGMSAETFWGGLEGNIAFERDIKNQIGDLGLTTGAGTTKDALEKFSCKKFR
jgi:maleate isomerase